MHDDACDRVLEWIDCGDVLLPFHRSMLVEDLTDGGVPRGRKRARVSYDDGRVVETRASKRAVLRAIAGDDDAVTFDPIVGEPRELESKP